MRIDKCLSQLKYGSRNEIKDMIRSKRIKVNGNIIFDQRFQVNPELDEIFVDQIKIFYKKNIDLMIYKPIGYLSAHKDLMHPCVMELIKDPYHRFDLTIAGRLDLDAEGLMILSTDGEFIHQITHPKYHLEKTYEVLLDQPFTLPEALLEGVWILDGRNEPYLAKAQKLHYHQNHVTLSIDEGKFHQVKRMFQAIHYEVLSLKRVSIGNLTLKDLKPGEYQEFEREELYD